MNNGHDAAAFIVLIAIINSIVRKTHIALESCPGIRGLNAGIYPFAPENEALLTGTLRPNPGALITFGLDGQTTGEERALGVGLSINFNGKDWIADGEIGFSAADTGWDPFWSNDFVATSFEQFMNEVPAFARMIFGEYLAKARNAGN